MPLSGIGLLIVVPEWRNEAVSIFFGSGVLNCRKELLSNFFGLWTLLFSVVVGSLAL